MSCFFIVSVHVGQDPHSHSAKRFCKYFTAKKVEYLFYIYVRSHPPRFCDVPNKIKSWDCNFFFARSCNVWPFPTQRASTAPNGSAITDGLDFESAALESIFQNNLLSVTQSSILCFCYGASGSSSPPRSSQARMSGLTSAHFIHIFFFSYIYVFFLTLLSWGLTYPNG
ncbi:hypothetical protein ABFS83_10G109200 [Erythranthe nasuta]